MKSETIENTLYTAGCTCGVLLILIYLIFSVFSGQEKISALHSLEAMPITELHSQKTSNYKMDVCPGEDENHKKVTWIGQYGKYLFSVSIAEDGTLIVINDGEKR